MTDFTTSITSRRSFLAASGASLGLLALPGCATLGGFGAVDAIRRILLLSSERAFASLTQPGGWYDNQIFKLGLNDVLGSRGGILSTILTSGLVKNALEREFANFAVEGAERAAPLVYDAVRTIGFGNAVALITGNPTAATGYLRQNLGVSLVEAMVPEIGEAMRLSRDPAVGQLLSALTGVDTSAVISNFAAEANDVIWQEIGSQEAAIRANPRATNDPAIIAILGAGSAF